jgi:Ran GTPase-activating protein (RanGAP) involved in mRNA processing and transport
MYEDIQENEYLDLSKRELGVTGTLDIFKDMSEDSLMKQLDLSYNIVAEEFYNPRIVENFLKKFKLHLSKNKTLTALDLAGNYLFHYHPHPSNEHVKNYEKELTNALLATKISRIDLSDNNITGFTGRELDGFVYFCKNYVIKQGIALQLRHNKLNSLGYHALTHALGIYSNLTYLDVSDNLGGYDANGRSSSEGIEAFTKILNQTMKLRTLKIARNYLYDKEIDMISTSIHYLSEFQDLDISGNMGRYYCCRLLKDAIVSLGVNWDNSGTRLTGFRELNLSTNPIGDSGIKEICLAIKRTLTLKILRIANCGITEQGGQWLQDALSENSTIIVIDAYGNLMSEEQESLVVAEIEANEILEQISKDPLGIDVESLYIDVMFLVDFRLFYALICYFVVFI